MVKYAYVNVELGFILGYTFDGMVGKAVEDREEENGDLGANQELIHLSYIFYK